MRSCRRRSDQVAGWLRSQRRATRDRIMLMLGNQVELWETILAAIKLGAVLIPATTLLAAADLRDRVDRGGARFVIARASMRRLRDGARRLRADRRRRSGCRSAGSLRGQPLRRQRVSSRTG